MIDVTTPVGWIDYSRFWDEMADPLWNIRDTWGVLYRKAVIEKHLLDPKCVEYKVPAGGVVFTDTVDMVGVLETARKWAIMHQPTVDTAVLDRVKSDTGFASAVRLLRMANLPIRIDGDIVYNRLNPTKLMDDRVVAVMDLCTDIIALMPTTLQNKRRCDSMAWLIGTVVSELYTVYYAYCEHLKAVLDADGEDVSDIKLDTFVRDNVIGYLDKNELWSISEVDEEIWLTEQDIAERKRKEREAKEAEERRKREEEHAKEVERQREIDAKNHKSEYQKRRQRFNDITNTLLNADMVIDDIAKVIKYFNEDHSDWDTKNENVRYAEVLASAIHFIAIVTGCNRGALTDVEVAQRFITCFGVVDVECNCEWLKDELKVPSDEALDARIESVNYILQKIRRKRDNAYIHIITTEQLGCGNMVSIEVIKK